MRLRREAPDPLYMQVKASLKAAIAAGEYRADQRLPSERELCKAFQVSRITVRQALLDLARDGTIYTRIGKGTFVAAPKIEQQLRSFSGFTQEVRGRGSRPTSLVLEARRTPASDDVAYALHLQPATEVFLLARVRLTDEVPMAIEVAHLPAERFPELLSHDFAVESLYDVLERRYHITLHQANQTLEAALATYHETELLHLVPPAAVLRLQRVTSTPDGLPVEYVSSAYRSDRYKFHSTLYPRMALG